jgi:hypothetical protein
MECSITQVKDHQKPWNKGKLVGQKVPLRLKEIWAIRIRLQLAERIRSLLCLIWPSIASCAHVIW